MLVVHVSSTCDVCCDPLSSSNECAKAPYSISCGHVFYRACLLNIPPDRYSQHKSERRCPMCRASYTNNDIHKLQLGYSSNSNSKPNRRSELDEEMELVRAYIDHFAPEKGQPRGDEKRWTALMDTFHERKLSGKSCSYFDRLLTLCSAPTKANVDTAVPRSINGSIKAPGSEAGSNHSAHSSKHGNDRLPHSYEDSWTETEKGL
ncbi:hypothetical protein CPB85DRAFT_1432699 [Mucidula mucida]|nr:hypothetical protein CPB85DRAFT_1432699 [Mucidula mucida]